MFTYTNHVFYYYYHITYIEIIWATVSTTALYLFYLIYASNTPLRWMFTVNLSHLSLLSASGTSQGNPTQRDQWLGDVSLERESTWAWLGELWINLLQGMLGSSRIFSLWVIASLVWNRWAANLGSLTWKSTATLSPCVILFYLSIKMFPFVGFICSVWDLGGKVPRKNVCVC